MAPSHFKSQLEASSYHAPGGGELYKPLREKIVKQALDQGYDEATMFEHAVTWADDQDPWGHIANASYPRFSSACNYRLFESFEAQLKHKFADFIKARGIGVIVASTTLQLKRPVTYPDALVVANRVGDVKADRYFVTTTMWSLQQQAPVAESSGWVVFFDYAKGKPANLLQEGGVYADLHAALSSKSTVANEKKAAWDQAHPKKPRAKI